MNDDDFDRACQFLNALAAALQRYGVSSRAMESLLSRVARALHVHGEFQAIPTQVQSIIWTDENRQRLHVTVSSAGDYDLARLAQVTELAEQVASGAISPGVGWDRLRVIESDASRRPAWLDAAGFALCAVGFAVILGLSWRDVLLGGALSLVPFGFNRLAADSQGLAHALELVVAGAACALATLLCLVFPGSNPLGVTVCALIYFVPGFGLTLGADELMSGNTLSGLLGFTRATVTAVKLLVGALIGAALVRNQVTVPVPSGAAGVPHAWTWLFVPMLVLGLAILFRVRRRDLLWPLLAGVIVWSGVEAGSGLGFWQGTFIGAFALTSASHVFVKKSKLPGAIILLPAVMLLVPGVPTLRAFYTAETQGLVEGLRSLYEVIVLIAAILGGVLLGDAIWSIRRPRFPPIFSGISRTHSKDHR